MSDKEKAVVQRFTPGHVRAQGPADLDSLKTEITDMVQGKDIEPITPPKKSLKTEREYTFNLDWTSRTGKRYTGEFTNRILTLGDKQAVGLMRAKIAGGLPVDSIDVITAEINLIVSHLTFSLVKRPAWAMDLRQLDELALLQAIYEEVATHEATFFGYGPDKEAGAE